MIAHHPVPALAVNIARVLVEQVMNLVVVVEHQHEHDDGELTACTGLQVGHAALAVFFQCCDEGAYIARHDCLCRLGVYFPGVFIPWVV